MRNYIEKFKALSDETRLRILHLLVKSQKELCVCEFTDALEVPQYNISRHLKILKNAGLVIERKEGRWVYFNAIKEENPFSEYLLDAIASIPKSFVSGDFNELDKRLSIRVDGKCLLGIQKKHLISNHTNKEIV